MDTHSNDRHDPLLHDASKKPGFDMDRTIANDTTITSCLLTTVSAIGYDNQENMSIVDFNSWTNMIIDYSNNYSIATATKLTTAVSKNNTITPESEYMFLFRADGINSIIWLPNIKNKLKGKNSKIKLDKINRLIIVDIESKSSINGIKRISFEINDIISINVGCNNVTILQEIGDPDKHLWMNIKSYLN